MNVVHAAFEPVSPFAYRCSPVEVDNHTSEHGVHYRLRRLTFESVGSNGQSGHPVTVDFYQSTLPGRWPVVIVIPVWGISNYPSTKIAKAIRNKSDGTFHVFHMRGDTHLLDWELLGDARSEEEFLAAWHESVERERATVIDIRRLIDWAEERPEIDADRIGLIGFSHSAMLAATLAVNEPRIAATVLVFGGARPHEIVARCDGLRTTGLREKVTREFGWSLEEYERRLEPIFRVMDPAQYPARVDPASVLLFEAEEDTCISRGSREALCAAMGMPERYTIDANHRGAFLTMTPLYFNWLRHRVWEFFNHTLADEGRRHDLEADVRRSRATEVLSVRGLDSGK
jgi:dienelactone hydrolase